MSKKQKSDYERFADANKKLRESNLAPDPYKDLDKQGMSGKALKIIADKAKEEPLRVLSYKTVVIIYDKNKHSPYIGSALYTGFKWMYLLLMTLCFPFAIIIVILAVIRKIFKWKEWYVIGWRNIKIYFWRCLGCY